MKLTNVLGGLAEAQKQQVYLISILAVSVVFRIGVALYMGNEVISMPGTADQLSYHNLALRVLGGHGFTFGEDWWPATKAGAPTAHWSYLYTFYLTAVYGLFGQLPLAARLIQSVAVGILQPFLVYHIAQHTFNSTVGLVSAAFTAVYAYFVYYAAALMTESFYICALLGTIYLVLKIVDFPETGPTSERRHFFALCVAFGMCLSAAVLLRQLILFLIPPLLLWMWLAGRKRPSLRQIFASLAIAAGILAVLVLPFTLYNYLRFGQFVLLNTNAGFAFFWANHPIHGTAFQPILSPESGTYGELIPREVYQLNLSEAQLDQELLKRGFQFVQDDPLRYILLSISRIPAYFMFWPSSESSIISNISRVASFGILWPLMLYGLIISFKGYSPRGSTLISPVSLLALFGLFYTGMHVLSWALIRYRLPVDAVLLVFAGAGGNKTGSTLNALAETCHSPHSSI